MGKRKLTFIVAWIMVGTFILGGCSDPKIVNVDINPPTKGLLHYLKQDQMVNVSDNGYKVRVESSTAEVNSETEVKLTLRVLDSSGLPVRKFSEDMTKLMHLIVVSSDLSSFSHLHPEYKGKGIFSVAYKFPFGGDFLLISEFMPDKQGVTVYKQWISVKGKSPLAEKLISDTATKQTVGGLDVSLSMMPDAKHLAAGQTAMLNFRFTDAKTHKPVKLEPYLGTAGHCVILNDTANQYLHVHAATDMSSGENVMFHTQFPASGTYKLWAQVQYGGKVNVVPYVIRVQ
ncbi:hypothetical protein [Cohnella silvisoli]|uniref:YtkA-like domain-containing protein n=1 Tax=Cohnella silvisoli TaxID=2873699 RepID=A0ABV1KQA2_9BACL|nr:hypothetical protein [Cohnella silvisoli]MCD9022061.1 hypothetical protein [Cohnella silvisoli]